MKAMILKEICGIKVDGRTQQSFNIPFIILIIWFLSDFYIINEINIIFIKHFYILYNVICNFMSN
jgi:hypothetical protein